jgi:hypothetical protein
VDFGDRADRRSRVARRGFLLDGNSRREAVDLIDVRLLHHLQELPRVSGETLDIAALALGIDGVEGERALAGAGKAGKDHQFVARQVEVDVLEVMLARAADGNRPRVYGAAALAAAAFVGAIKQVGHSLIRSSPPHGDPNCGRTILRHCGFPFARKRAEKEPASAVSTDYPNIVRTWRICQRGSRLLPGKSAGIAPQNGMVVPTLGMAVAIQPRTRMVLSSGRSGASSLGLCEATSLSAIMHRNMHTAQFDTQRE